MVFRVEGLFHKGLLEFGHLVSTLDEESVLRLLYLVFEVIRSSCLAEIAEAGWIVLACGTVRRAAGLA